MHSERGPQHAANIGCSALQISRGQDLAREGNIFLMRPQHFCEICMDVVVAYSRQRLAQLADDPALAAIEEGDTLAKIGDRDCLLVKGTDSCRGRDTEHLEVTR